MSDAPTPAPPSPSAALHRPYSMLLSFHYFRGAENVARIAAFKRGGLALIADSGAFSAKNAGATVDIDEFAAWARDVTPHVDWVASLDVIGDPAATLRNWQRMHDAGLAHLVPTIHFGTPASALDAYADRGVSFVGLGGLVGVRDTKAVLRWLVSVFRYARDNHPAMRFHGWGITKGQVLAHVPFYSVDSSGFGSGFRYGTARLFDPTAGKVVAVDLDGSTPGRYGPLLRRHYGVTPRSVARSHSANRALVQRLAFLAAQRMEEFYTARHAVTAPPGYEHLGPGTRVHYAESDSAAFPRAVSIINEGNPS